MCCNRTFIRVPAEYAGDDPGIGTVVQVQNQFMNSISVGIVCGILSVALQLWQILTGLYYIKDLAGISVYIHIYVYTSFAPSETSDLSVMICDKVVTSHMYLNLRQVYLGSQDYGYGKLEHSIVS